MKITGEKVINKCDNCGTEITEPISMLNEDKKEVRCPVCGRITK